MLLCCPIPHPGLFLFLSSSELPLDSLVHSQGVLVPPPALKFCAHSRQDRAPLWAPSALRWLPAAISTLLFSNLFWCLLWFHCKEVSQGYQSTIWYSQKGSANQNVNPGFFSSNHKPCPATMEEKLVCNLFLTNPCWLLFISLLFPPCLQANWLMNCHHISGIDIILICLWNFSLLFFFSWFRTKS